MIITSRVMTGVNLLPSPAGAGLRQATAIEDSLCLHFSLIESPALEQLALGVWSVGWEEGKAGQGSFYLFGDCAGDSSWVLVGIQS